MAFGARHVKFGVETSKHIYKFCIKCLQVASQQLQMWQQLSDKFNVDTVILLLLQ